MTFDELVEKANKELENSLVTFTFNRGCVAYSDLQKMQGVANMLQVEFEALRDQALAEQVGKDLDDADWEKVDEIASSLYDLDGILATCMDSIDDAGLLDEERDDEDRTLEHLEQILYDLTDFIEGIPGLEAV